jgi:hypothetical protein
MTLIVWTPMLRIGWMMVGAADSGVNLGGRLDQNDFAF